MKSFKIISFIFLFLVLFTTRTSAQVLPETSRVDWSSAGSSFVFPITAPQVSILSFGGVADGATDNTVALTNAMASFGGHPGIVFFPAGLYLFSSVVSIPDSVWLTGAGPDSTFIKIGHSSTGFSFSGTATNIFTDVISGFQKESHKITVANPALFQPGNYCEIRQDNGSWDVEPATWATYSVGQMILVDSIIGDTLVLADGLHITFDTSLNLQIQKINPRKASGISCINVARTDSSTVNSGNNFGFIYAVNCVIRGVESNKSQGSHCMIRLSSHISLEGCYFHDAFLYDGSSTKGYGITCTNHATLCLIQNNIFNHLRHAMMTKQGANGNVFAYNYSLNPFRNGSMEYPQDYCGDISLHGHYSFANLFEGNIVQTIMIDETWGPSGPYNTFFRNRAERYGIIMAATLTNNQNFVGNEITGTDYTFPFQWGAYTITGSGNIQYGNNDNGTIVPNGTNVLNDNSYYLETAPAFWGVSMAWPDIGTPNLLNVGTSPAKDRFYSMELTDCSLHSLITKTTITTPEDILIFPNPTTSRLFITLPGENNFCRVQIKDLTGKCLIDRINNAAFYEAGTDISSLKPGIYVVCVNASNHQYTSKIVKF